MKILQPRLSNDLASVDDLTTLFTREDDIVEIQSEGQSVAGVQTKNASMRDSLMAKTDFSLAELEKFDVANCVIKGSNLSGCGFSDSSWRTVWVDNSRCSGMQIQDSTLKNIRFSNSKLEIVNFRFAKMENIVFEDCVLDDVDFYGATLKNVEFVNCTISKITFASAKLQNVDLSKSTIDSVQGIASIKGATISYDQLLQLAPYFATEAGVKVID